MATLKQRLHRKNASGTYDVIYFETSADLITGTLGIAHGGTGATAAEQALENLKGMSSLLKYYNASANPDIDTIIDSAFIFPSNYSKNCPVFGSWIIIIQFFYGSVSATSNRTQIAFSYQVSSTQTGGMAIRKCYKSEDNVVWSDWEQIYTSSRGTVSIEHGGTGATTAATALTNLGAAAKSTQVSATLLASGWSSTTPPTQTVAVSGLGASQNGQIGLNKTATQTQRKAAAEAMLGITAQTAGSLTIVADGAKPTVNIPILITLLG